MDHWAYSGSTGTGICGRTFQHCWSRRQATRSRNGKPAVLWPDTFSNYFLPSTLRAAVHVLKEAGYKAIVPTAWQAALYGRLDLARTKLRAACAAYYWHFRIYGRWTSALSGRLRDKTCIKREALVCSRDRDEPRANNFEDHGMRAVDNRVHRRRVGEHR